MWQGFESRYVCHNRIRGFSSGSSLESLVWSKQNINVFYKKNHLQRRRWYRNTLDDTVCI